jgi:hypothetical protein
MFTSELLSEGKQPNLLFYKPQPRYFKTLFLFAAVRGGV